MNGTRIGGEDVGPVRPEGWNCEFGDEAVDDLLERNVASW